VGNAVFNRILRWRTRIGSSNKLASFSDNNVFQNLKIGSLRRQHLTCATTGNIFYTLKINMAAKPESGGSKNFEREGAEDNLSAPSSFIANAHNEIYAFYTEKAAF